jgi:molybdenum cofactor guanylyltransferase
MHLPEVTGVVLAGGRSTRFGRDKLLEPYRGTPIVHRVILRLAEVCGDVVVVLPPDGAEPSMPLGAPVRFVRDPEEGEGPLAGTYAGLIAVRSSHALLAAGDMPDLRTGVLLEMLRVADEAPADAIALADEGRFRPLPTVVATERARDVAHALLHDGHRRLRDLFEALRVAVIDEPTWRAIDPTARTLFDVDEPADLER